MLPKVAVDIKKRTREAGVVNDIILLNFYRLLCELLDKNAARFLFTLDAKVVGHRNGKERVSLSH